MINLFLLILPLYLLIAIGFFAMRTKLLAPEAIPTLGAFVMNIALPAMMLNALMGQNLTEAFNLGYVLAYAIGSLAVFGAILLFFLQVLRKPFSHAVIAAFGSAASNTGFVGLPVVTLVFGSTALAAVSMTFVVEVLLIMPLALILAEMGGKKDHALHAVLRDTARNLIRSPLLLSIIAGSLLSALGIQFVAPVAKTISLLGAAAIPCALLIIGGILANTKARTLDLEPIWISIGKLVLHPIAVALCFMLMSGVPDELRATGIVLASSPMLSIYPIIGARFKLEALSATALFIATSLSFITITLILALV